MLDVAHEDGVSALLDCDTALLRIPTRLEWVDRTAHYLRRRVEDCGASNAGRGEQLLVALHEALTNAIVHGNLGVPSSLKEQPDGAFARALAERSADPALASREVRVNFHYDGQRCEIRICDEGEGFDWRKRLASLDSADPDAAPSMLCSGRGIIIMRAFTDGVRYDQDGREVILTMFAAHHQERRTGGRRAWSRAVRVVPVNADGVPDRHHAWDALTQDLSEGGFALIQSRGHTARRVLIELRDGDRPVYLSAEVCRVTTVDDGLFQIGCRFTRDASPGAAPAVPPAAPPADVLRLLASVEEMSAQHPRRAHQRVGYTCPIEIRLPGEARFRAAFSRDLSRGGIAFITSFGVSCGPVELRLPSPGGEPIAALAHAVRCQRVTEGVFDVGCEFA